MPDTTVRDGWAIGVAVYLKPFPPDSAGALHSEQCVVVTGRTAQDVEKALALLDRDRTGKAWLDAPYLETVRA